MGRPNWLPVPEIALETLLGEGSFSRVSWNDFFQARCWLSKDSGFFLLEHKKPDFNLLFLRFRQRLGTFFQLKILNVHRPVGLTFQMVQNFIRKTIWILCIHQITRTLTNE